MHMTEDKFVRTRDTHARDDDDDVYSFGDYNERV